MLPLADHYDWHHCQYNLILRSFLIYGSAAMFEEDIELAIKVLIVGNGAVGKSSMIQRYCKGVFTHEYKKTIGVDFLEKKIQFVVPSYSPS
jgi:hypothetical protein